MVLRVSETHVQNGTRTFRPRTFRPRMFRPWTFRPRKMPKVDVSTITIILGLGFVHTEMCDAFFNLLKSGMHVNTYKTIDECLLLSC